MNEYIYFVLIFVNTLEKENSIYLFFLQDVKYFLYNNLYNNIL